MNASSRRRIAVGIVFALIPLAAKSDVDQYQSALSFFESGDSEESLNKLLPLAENGHGDSGFLIGWMCFNERVERPEVCKSGKFAPEGLNWFIASASLGHERSAHALVQLHKAETERLGSSFVNERATLAVIDEIETAIGSSFPGASVELMLYYLEKYSETNNRMFLTRANNVGYEANFKKKLFDTGTGSRVPEAAHRQLEQYGELLAARVGLLKAEQTLDYVFVRKRAGRFLESSYPNIAAEARQIYELADAKIKGASDRVGTLEFFFVVGQLLVELMPDRPTLPNADVNVPVWKYNVPMDVELAWLK